LFANVFLSDIVPFMEKMIINDGFGEWLVEYDPAAEEIKAITIHNPAPDEVQSYSISDFSKTELKHYNLIAYKEYMENYR